MSHATIDRVTADLWEGPWWIAHEQPERPPDEWVVWDWGCDACFVHLIAAQSVMDTDQPSQYVTDLGEVEIDGTFGEVLQEAIAWRQRNGFSTMGLTEASQETHGQDGVQTR